MDALHNGQNVLLSTQNVYHTFGSRGHQLPTTDYKICPPSAGHVVPRLVLLVDVGLLVPGRELPDAVQRALPPPGPGGSTQRLEALPLRTVPAPSLRCA